MQGWSLPRASGPDDERAIGGHPLGVPATSYVVAWWKFMRNEVIADREIEDLFLGFTGGKDPFRWIKAGLPTADASVRPTYIELEGARTIIFWKNRRIKGRNGGPVDRAVANQNGN